MIKHFDIFWPEGMSLLPDFSAELSTRFKPLFKGLENVQVSGNSGEIILQTLLGAHFHFGNFQSNLKEPAVITIETYVPALMTIISRKGTAGWEFSGQTEETLITKEGTHFSIGLPPGVNQLHLPIGFTHFQCFIMTDFRLQLLAKDHAHIQPIIRALEAGKTGEALRLPPCDTLKEMRDQLDYLQSKKTGSTADRDILYKKKQHQLLKLYDDQLSRLPGHSLFEKAREAIKQNGHVAGFNLTALASMLHVVPRRIQYVLAENGTTFTRLKQEYLHDSRAESK